MLPPTLVADSQLTEECRFEAQFARAGFASGHYESLARRFLERGTDNPHAALWAVRALIETEAYEDAAREATAWAAKPTRLAGEFLALLALARLYDGREIASVDQAIDEALERGADMGHVVRASIHVAYGQLDGAAAELGKVTSILDPYDVQVRLLVEITIAACRQDAEALQEARAKLNAFLTHESGLHYLGWCAFAVARTHFFQGAYAAAGNVLDAVGDVVCLSESRRFRRQVETIRELMRREAPPWQFTVPGVPHTAYVPRSMSGQAAGRRPLDVALRRRPTLNLLHATLLAAGDEGLTKDEIMRRLWGVSFDPVRHEARVYKALGRLRALLEECYGGTLAAYGSRYVLLSGSQESRAPS